MGRWVPTTILSVSYITLTSILSLEAMHVLRHGRLDSTKMLGFLLQWSLHLLGVCL